MNWKQLIVSENEYKALVDHNEPIRTKDIDDNAGVEVHCMSLGKMLNAIYDAELGGVRKLRTDNPVFKDMPNRDLQLYNDLLLSKHINTIIVDGFFGTGKTSTVSTHLVTGLVKGTIPAAYISKPHVPLGRSYGHLPGEMENKTKLEFQSFTQYFDRYGQPMLADKLMGSLPPRNGGKPDPQVLHLLTFEYLRGRDIVDEGGWMILDEAQNTNVSEMASIVSRVGDKVKFVILGDSTPAQIDRQGNSTEKNGLTFAKKTFANKKYSGTVEFQTVKHILRGQRVRDLHAALKSTNTP